MPRLIDADALKESVPKTNVDAFENCRNCTTLMDYEVTELIDKQPTVDAVEVVRCKECKFWDRTNMVTDIGFPDLARCLRGHEDYSDEFWYCADGERKDDGNV